MHAVKLTTVLLASAALGLAACGGGGDSKSSTSTSSGGRLTKSEYVKQADALCRAESAKLAKLPEPSSIDDLTTYVTKAKDITGDGVARLSQLKPPADLQAAHDAYLATGRRIIALTDDLAAAAKAGDQAKVQKISAQGDRLDQTARAQERRLGITGCGKA